MSDLYNPKESLQFTTNELREYAADTDAAFPHFTKEFEPTPLVAIQAEKKTREKPNKNDHNNTKEANQPPQAKDFENKNKNKNKNKKKDQNQSQEPKANSSDVEASAKQTSKSVKLNPNFIASSADSESQSNAQHASAIPAKPKEKSHEKEKNKDKDEDSTKHPRANSLPHVLPSGVSIKKTKNTLVPQGNHGLSITKTPENLIQKDKKYNEKTEPTPAPPTQSSAPIKINILNIVQNPASKPVGQEVKQTPTLNPLNFAQTKSDNSPEKVENDLQPGSDQKSQNKSESKASKAENTKKQENQSEKPKKQKNKKQKNQQNQSDMIDMPPGFENQSENSQVKSSDIIQPVVVDNNSQPPKLNPSMFAPLDIVTPKTEDQNNNLPPGFGGPAPVENATNQEIIVEKVISEPVSSNSDLSPGIDSKPADNDMPPGFNPPAEDLPPGFPPPAGQDDNYPPGFGVKPENNTSAPIPEPVFPSHPESPPKESKTIVSSPSLGDSNFSDSSFAPRENSSEMEEDEFYDPLMGDQFNTITSTDEEEEEDTEEYTDTEDDNIAEQNSLMQNTEQTIICDFNGTLGFIARVNELCINVYIKTSGQHQIIELSEPIRCGAVVGHNFVIGCTNNVLIINSELTATIINGEQFFQMKADPNGANRFFALNNKYELHAITLNGTNLDKKLIYENVKNFDASSKYILMMLSQKKYQIMDRTGSSFLPLISSKFNKESNAYVDDTFLYQAVPDMRLCTLSKILTDVQPLGYTGFGGIWSSQGGVAFVANEDNLIVPGKSINDKKCIGAAIYNNTALVWTEVDQMPEEVSIQKPKGQLSEKVTESLKNCADNFFKSVENKVNQYKNEVNMSIEHYKNKLTTSVISLNTLTESLMEPLEELKSTIRNLGATPQDCINMFERNPEKAIICAIRNNFLGYLAINGDLEKIDSIEISQPTLIQLLPALCDLLLKGNDVVNVLKCAVERLDKDDLFVSFTVGEIKQKLIVVLNQAKKHGDEDIIDSIITALGNF